MGSQSLEETVRSSEDEWPDSLQVKVSLGGSAQEILDSETMAEVRSG